MLVYVMQNVKIQCLIAQEYKDTNNLKCTRFVVHIMLYITVEFRNRSCSRCSFNNFNKNSFSQREASAVSSVGRSETVTSYFMNFESHADNAQNSQNSRLFLLNSFAGAVFTETFSVTTVPHSIETTLQQMIVERFISLVTCIICSILINF
jgi:hypothetical protein